VATAGGLEYAGGTGARSLARGGAVHAKADTPLVLRYNPAGLAELRGGSFIGSFNVALHQACFDAYGFYGWGVGDAMGDAELTAPGGQRDVIALDAPDYLGEPLPEVCMKQAVTMIPNGALSYRLTESLGVGFGMIFPSAMPGGRWADGHGLIRNDAGELRPSPARHMMVASGTTGIFPTLGVGYRVTDYLRLGVALQWGIVWADLTVNTAKDPGNEPGDDVLNRIIGEDLFVPGVNASVHLVPMDAVDAVLTFRWQDDIELDRTTIYATTGVFEQREQPLADQELFLTTIEQPLPWSATLAIRYADRLLPRPTGTGRGEAALGDIRDPMRDERWDVELDVQYQFNGRVDRTVARPDDTCDAQLQGCSQIITERTDSDVPDVIAFPSEAQRDGIVIERRWRDQVSVRLGGSYNVLPGLLSLHAGAHWENRGIDPAYMTPDAWPLARVGLHTGVTYRYRMLDFTLAYGHIFQETLRVGSPDIDGAAVDPSEPADVDAVAAFEQQAGREQAGEQPAIVNAGQYVSALELFAFSIMAHF